jgi:hypothetical protein
MAAAFWNSCFLDRSFKMHFIGKLDGFDKNLNTIYKEEIEEEG